MVSNDPHPDLRNQISEALAFLSQHEPEIRRMNQHGMDNRLFDFGVERQNTIERYAYLPPQLLMAMARFEMGVTMCSYVLPKGVFIVTTPAPSLIPLLGFGVSVHLCRAT